MGGWGFGGGGSGSRREGGGVLEGANTAKNLPCDGSSAQQEKVGVQQSAEVYQYTMQHLPRKGDTLHFTLQFTEIYKTNSNPVNSPCDSGCAQQEKVSVQQCLQTEVREILEHQIYTKQRGRGQHRCQGPFLDCQLLPGFAGKAPVCTNVDSQHTKADEIRQVCRNREDRERTGRGCKWVVVHTEGAICI